MSLPWWKQVDLPVLRFVRTVMAEQQLDLVLAEGAVAIEGALLEVPIADEQGTIGSLAATPKHANAHGPGSAPGSQTSVAVARAILVPAAAEVAKLLRSRQKHVPADDTPPAASRVARDSYDALTGSSDKMLSLYAMIDRIAISDTTVLIQGENGTGKELVARAIHHRSPRVNHRFVATNCSAFNDNLLDSELFGHKRGAFTGAVVDKPGLFEIADGGTFFLDEIGDMSPALQVKVLRVLQEGTFNRVGDVDTRKVDVRIVAATNRDLAAMVQQGTFREDLFYRINVINLVLPPLRERLGDIPMLIDAFLQKEHPSATAATKLAPECLKLLCAYPWPGNVRELENEMERLVVLAGDTPVISHELLSPRIRDYTMSGEAPLPPDASLPQAIERLERTMIAQSLVEFRGNKTKAADKLGISRRNLIRLVQKYQLP